MDKVNSCLEGCKASQSMHEMQFYHEGGELLNKRMKKNDIVHWNSKDR